MNDLPKGLFHFNCKEEEEEENNQFVNTSASSVQACELLNG